MIKLWVTLTQYDLSCKNEFPKNNLYETQK